METNLVGTLVNSALSTTGLTLYVEFIDSKTGVARTPQSSTNVFVIEKDTENFEMILADSHSTTSGVTTITINASGRALNEYEEGVGSATGLAHPIGAEVGCAEVQAPFGTLNKIMDGTNSTTGTAFRIGAGTDVDITLYAENADVNKPFIQYDSATNTWIFSNDGTSTTDVGGGTSSITAGDGIAISAGVVSVDIVTDDLAATPGLEFSTGLKVKVKSGGGVTLDSDGLSSDKPTISLTAYEAISIDQAVALLPIEVEHFAQLTDANLALGNSNIRRKYAIKIIPSVTSSTLTTMQFRAAEAVNGATTLGDLTISIQTNNAGAPSGTAVTNGTANVITQATQRTWNTTQGSRTATWGSSPTLTGGTIYWIVFEVAGTDGTNYLNLGVNSTYDENYLTFTRLTYDLDTASWGSSVTNATPFFWFNTQVKLLGMGLCPTDADWGGRTWSFAGFAKAAISANASGEVYYELVPDISGLTKGADYWLSLTAGAITITKPDSIYGNDNAYKIGRAMGDGTTLKIELGEKMIWGSISTAGTLASQLILWFKPSYIEIEGSSYISGGNPGYGSNSSGIYDGTNNYCRINTMAIVGGTTAYTSSTSPTTSLDGNSAFTGTGSALTGIGFTYTLTDAGTGSNADVIWKAYA